MHTDVLCTYSEHGDMRKALEKYQHALQVASKGTDKILTALLQLKMVGCCVRVCVGQNWCGFCTVAQTENNNTNNNRRVACSKNLILRMRQVKRHC